MVSAEKTKSASGIRQKKRTMKHAPDLEGNLKHVKIILGSNNCFRSPKMFFEKKNVFRSERKSQSVTEAAEKFFPHNLRR
jgi:hypothetical protein